MNRGSDQLGGGRATVKHGMQAECPCGRHNALVLVLDAKHGGKDLLVAECPQKGYLWFTKRT